MSNTIKLHVVTRTQDNGDGGYTTYVYNNEQELIADHPAVADSDHPVAPEFIADILNENDPYEHGYIGSSTIEITLNADGSATLTKPFHIHAGQ